LSDEFPNFPQAQGIVRRSGELPGIIVAIRQQEEISPFWLLVLEIFMTTSINFVLALHFNGARDLEVFPS
jgi:hypothetical protein